jgi:hypothetical protein
MMLARRSTRFGLLCALSLLLALAPAASAGVACTVPQCTQCIADPTCTQCTPGYTVGGGGTVCNDVNECATTNGGCSTSPVAQCTNTAGSRNCTCPSGYGGTGTIGNCTDINECATTNGGCSTSPLVACTNTAGSRTCGACPSGYTGTGITCNDVNECATTNGGCSISPVAQCTNTAGSRNCTCPSGYGGGGLTCTDINECATNNGGCSTSPPVTCTNTAGSRACDACPIGYTGDGVTCPDINECAAGNGGCALEGGACTNTSGSRNCTCLSGYAGDGISCGDINECSLNGGGCDPLTTCSNLPGTRTCSSCPSGYDGTGDTACADVNECATANTCNSGACVNGAGSFTCDCPAGVTGTTCDTNGYLPPDKNTAGCEKAVVENVAKYVKCVTKCRVQKAGKELGGKAFDEQDCQAGTAGGKSCRDAYDKKMASLIAKGTCPACLDQTAQGGLARRCPQRRDRHEGQRVL